MNSDVPTAHATKLLLPQTAEPLGPQLARRLRGGELLRREAHGIRGGGSTHREIRGNSGEIRGTSVGLAKLAELKPRELYIPFHRSKISLLKELNLSSSERMLRIT